MTTPTPSTVAALLLASSFVVYPLPTLVPHVGATSPAAAAQAKQTPESLDMLLASIALYPDPLLAQMLVSAGQPDKVVELNGWLKKNASLKGSALQDAAVKAGFEPSLVALALFPQVVQTMAADLSWTRELGQAFAADRSAVFESIQRLRAASKEVGTLKSTPQQTVETQTTQSGQQVIVIEPTNPQVVYVPQYNAQTVYTQAPTTVVVQEDDDDEAAAIAAGAVGFAAGIAIGAAMDNDYYYGPYGWHGGGYMYNDAWEDREDAREDYYEHREDAREDYYENREDVAGERSERAQNTQQQRTERTQTRQENAPATQAQREQRRTDAQATAQQRSAGTATTAQSRGYSEQRTGTAAQRSGTAAQRSGGGSDAFSGYSSGRSERAASSRGQSSRSSAGRSGGGRRR